MEQKARGIETPISKLRNVLTPIYGLADILLSVDFSDKEQVDLLIKCAKQAVENKESIHILLKEIEYATLLTEEKDKRIKELEEACADYSYNLKNKEDLIDKLKIELISYKEAQSKRIFRNY